MPVDNGVLKVQRVAFQAAHTCMRDGYTCVFVARALGSTHRSWLGLKSGLWCGKMYNVTEKHGPLATLVRKITLIKKYRI